MSYTSNIPARPDRDPPEPPPHPAPDDPPEALPPRDADAAVAVPDGAAPPLGNLKVGYLRPTVPPPHELNDPPPHDVNVSTKPRPKNEGHSTPDAGGGGGIAIALPDTDPPDPPQVDADGGDAPRGDAKSPYAEYRQVADGVESAPDVRESPPPLMQADAPPPPPIQLGSPRQAPHPMTFETYQ